MKKVKGIHISESKVKITWEDNSVSKLGLEYMDGVLTRVGNTNIHY